MGGSDVLTAGCRQEVAESGGDEDVGAAATERACAESGSQVG